MQDLTSLQRAVWLPLNTDAQADLLMIFFVFEVSNTTGAAEDPVFFGHSVVHGNKATTCRIHSVSTSYEHSRT